MALYLDDIFNSNFYQNISEKGPFKKPGGVGAVIDNSAKAVKKIVDTCSNFFVPNAEVQIANRFVNNIHVPCQRNWTRACNGVMQGIILLIVSIIIKKKFPLMLVGIAWSIVGARHLQAVNYSNDFNQYYWRNTKMFWN